MTYILAMTLLINGAHVPAYFEFGSLGECLGAERAAYSNQSVDEYIVLKSRCMKA